MIILAPVQPLALTGTSTVRVWTIVRSGCPAIKTGAWTGKLQPAHADHSTGGYSRARHQFKPVPAEIQGDRVINRAGEDVTPQFRKGAEEAARLARLAGCTGALLKSRSPSCGVGRIYDGTFSGTLIDGDGLFAAALKALGIEVETEEG